MTPEKLVVQDRKLAVGDQVYHEVKSALSPDQAFALRGEIKDIHGGGFYGNVVILDDTVIKTTEPDAWHSLWRRINWREPFPPQSYEAAARLDHISAKIIHVLLPKVTGGLISAPDSYGYTHLGNLGYAQILERVHGRGAVFNGQINENEMIKSMRLQLWKTFIDYGVEHGGQIHPKNPFGKQNMWVGEHGRNYVMLDTLPAIKHTGFVFPMFNFPFHRDIRKAMDADHTTFNRINTDKFRKQLKKDRHLFDEESRELLEKLLDAYDRTEKKLERIETHNLRDKVVYDALNRGLIDNDQVCTLLASDTAFNKFLLHQIALPATQALIEFLQEGTLTKPFRKEFWQDIKKMATDSEFRRTTIMENSTLAGVIDAHELGLISQEDLNESYDLVLGKKATTKENAKLAANYITLQSIYTIEGSIINSIVLSMALAAPFREKPLESLAITGAVDLILPCIVRYLSTVAYSKIAKQDFKKAKSWSRLPKLGGYLAVPADMTYESGGQSEEIWHYVKRKLVALLSKTRPWGGLNSDLEEKLWNALRAEKW